MTNSQYGNLIVLVGGIQLLLVFTMWAGALLHPLSNSSWFSANIQSAGFWFALLGGGMLLTYLGLGIRSGHIQFTDEPTRYKNVIYSAVSFAVIGFLATLLLSTIFVFY